MSRTQVYLDNSATTQQDSRVTAAMLAMMERDYGNPSSLHPLGVEAEKRVKAARKALAESLGVSAEEIYFTSGGTEADNTALFGTAAARHRQGKRIITTAVEHPAVLEPARRLAELGFDVVYIGVDRQCRPDMQALQAALSEDTVLISVMGVNNETGTIMPIPEIAARKDAYNAAHGTKILLHCDGVQAFGKLPINLAGNFRGVDLFSLSGHKIHGPKGIGALYIRKGVRIEPFMLGGGQENHFRSGTENTPAIVGLGEAAKLCAETAQVVQQEAAAMAAVRAALLAGIQAEISDVLVNSPKDGCPSVLNVSFLGTRGEVVLHTLEQDGIFVSTGSACSSNKKGQSHVLTAMGLSAKEIEGAIRFSFSRWNTPEEMAYVVDRVKTAVNRFRRLGSFR